MDAAELAQRRILISQMISGAAAAVLVGMGTIVVVPMQDRAPGAVFWGLVIVSAALLSGSLIVCGRAIAKAEQPAGLFNLQAWLSTAGLVLFVVSLFLMGPKVQDPAVRTVSADLDTLRVQVEEARKDIDGLRRDIQSVRTTLDQLLLRERTSTATRAPGSKR